MENIIFEVFDHDTEQTFRLPLTQFVEWFNNSDDIYSITKVDKGENDE